MKVLVVHRQKEVTEQIRSVLHTNNSIIRFSDSGLDGLLAARIETFDLIICGTDLPVITGFELVRSLRTSSINKDTTVVLLADEINRQVQLLGDALGVSGVFGLNEMNEQLPAIIHDRVKVAPDNRWEDLLTSHSLN
jgi:CheY-like chemotaxis protein